LRELSGIWTNYKGIINRNQLFRAHIIILKVEGPENVESNEAPPWLGLTGQENF